MGYIYCAGATTQKVWQIDISDMNKIAESANYGARINALTTLGDYIYCAGHYDTGKVWKIAISDMSKVAESASFGAYISCYALATDGTYIYAAIDANKIWKIDPSDMSKVTESATISAINALTVLGNYIYCAGYANKVYKILLSDMTTVAESDDTGGDIYALTNDGTYIYCGVSTAYGRWVWKINPSDMSKVAEAINVGISYALTFHNEYVYCGGYYATKVYMIRPSDMAVMGEIDYGDIIYALIPDTIIGAGFLYCGGTIQKVWKLTTTLTKTAESADYGGTIYALVYSAVEPVVTAVTTQAATELSYACGMGNGTITSGTNATERGFEIVLSFSGTLANYVEHSIAGFAGDASYNVDTGHWEGTLTKTESETGDFVQGAYELVLGYPSVLGNPSSVFNDKLFKCESYTYRARATIGGVVYYGSYVAFSTLCDSGGDQQPTDDISEGNPTVPIIPIDIPSDYPPFEWEFLPEIPYPPWDWDLSDLPPWVLPDLPDWEIPDYPPLSFIGDFYYKKPYTKKDLDELRTKCIIYNKNSVEFALVLRHNMNVLKEFFNMMTDYMGKEEFNDFTDIIPPQRLKELYLDPLEVNDFKDMINGFIRNTVDNNIAVNRNFSLIQEGLSDYETGSDDAYFRDIYSAMTTVTEDNPDVDTLKRVIDNLNQETASNFSTIMHNLEILRAKLL